MKGFSAHAGVSPMKQDDLKTKFKHAKLDFATDFSRFRHAKSFNTVRPQQIATRKIAPKLMTKIGGKFLGPIGVALTAKDAYGTYKDVKKGMKFGKALKKNFLGIE